MGMIIPKEHGGLGFSALAHSEVVKRISSRSVAAAVTVMVPNSLGPAELLMRYGTDEQRGYYLPRLAEGREIPCFALDRAGGRVGRCRDRGPGRRLLRRAQGQARARHARHLEQALHHAGAGRDAARARVQALRSRPPLVGQGGDRHHARARSDRHARRADRAAAFPAGRRSRTARPRASDVFIPMDCVIGGRERVGQGWRMLMDCLAAGPRDLAARAGDGVCVFSRPLRRRLCAHPPAVRRADRQVRGHGGAARRGSAAIAYELEAARRLTCAGLDKGEQPAVVSAILKYHATERMRTALNDAMDIHGGQGDHATGRAIISATSTARADRHHGRGRERS